MKNKTILAVVGVGGLALAAYLIFRKTKSSSDEITPYDGSSGSGIFPVIGGLDYAGMADTIHEAMDGYGTWENTIENEITKLRNKSDWDALVAAYGNRKISSGVGNIFQSDFVGNLPAALNSELDSTEIASLNAKLRKIGVSI